VREDKGDSIKDGKPTCRKGVDRAERIVLSDRDTERVLKLLKNPSKPPAALLSAALRRRDRGG
jgi:uncharacterized protein (DUF1778 family)